MKSTRRCSTRSRERRGTDPRAASASEDSRSCAGAADRLVYGIHPVQEALAIRGARVEQVLVAREPNRRLQQLSEQAAAAGVLVRVMSAEELTLMCGGLSAHQGVAAVVSAYCYVALEDLIEPLEGGAAHGPLLLVVDGVTDPQNLGAMFRSALVFGATGVVLPRDRSAQVNATVVRVSAGATEHLPCAQVTNLARALRQLKRAGLWIAGTVERGGEDPARARLDGPLAVVLGSEQRGARRLTLRECDLLLTIPSLGAIASLNVAAATAAVLYEVARQRRQSSFLDSK